MYKITGSANKINEIDFGKDHFGSACRGPKRAIIYCRPIATSTGQFVAILIDGKHRDAVLRERSSNFHSFCDRSHKISLDFDKLVLIFSGK